MFLGVIGLSYVKWLQSSSNYLILPLAYYFFCRILIIISIFIPECYSQNKQGMPIDCHTIQHKLKLNCISRIATVLQVQIAMNGKQEQAMRLPSAKELFDAIQLLDLLLSKGNKRCQEPLLKSNSFFLAPKL